MNLEIIFTITIAVFGLTASICSIFCYRKLRQHRALLEFLGNKNDELEESVAENIEKLENYAVRTADQSRRMAWLETRVRQPKFASDEVLDETIITAPSKQNITERRHRVLTLASRGQDAENIATTLGMMRGEVELIINLNRVAA